MRTTRGGGASPCWSAFRPPPEGRVVRGGKDQAVGPGVWDGMAAASSALGWIVRQYCEAGRKRVASRRACTARNGRMRAAMTATAVGLAAMRDFRARCGCPRPTTRTEAGSLVMTFPVRGARGRTVAAVGFAMGAADRGCPHRINDHSQGTSPQHRPCALSC